MIKRKVVSKNVPPDVSAAKLLIAIKGTRDDYSLFSDEELENEKQRLLKILSEEDLNESEKSD